MTLRDWLAANSVTQTVFAGRIKRSVASVSRMVNGLQRPDLETAILIERETGGNVPANSWVEAA